MPSPLSTWRDKLKQRLKLQSLAERRVSYWRKQWLRAKPGTKRRTYAYHMLKNRKSALVKRTAQVAYARKRIRNLVNSVKINGNTVTGGTARQRVIAAADHSAYLDKIGKRNSFYDQDGAWTVSLGITGEHRWQRSDCSQWFTSMYHSAGVADPNGLNYTGGYTGTLGTHGRYVRQEDARPGDAVLYGPAPHHHVEMLRKGNKTIGHGTRAVDAGTVTMMADVHFATFDI